MSAKSLFLLRPVRYPCLMGYAIFDRVRDPRCSTGWRLVITRR